MNPDDFCEVIITAPEAEWLAGFVRLAGESLLDPASSGACTGGGCRAG